MIRWVTLVSAAGIMTIAAPTRAQDMPATTAPAMSMPMPMPMAPAMPMPMPAKQPHAKKGSVPKPAAASSPTENAATPGGMAGMVTPGMQPVGTALPAGDAPAPAPPIDHYADGQFSPDTMARARSALSHESGGQSFHQIFFNIAELEARKRETGYRWDGEAWFGGDINRLVLKTEGGGGVRSGVDSAEVQALYSRAIGPYFNLQGGVRHDFQPSPTRTYATIGLEGLAPYMLEVASAVFLSDKGDLLGRLEGYYDQRITQRIILQPRVELNFAAQDVPKDRLGAGLTNAELGLRLRYEITHQFAPYIGVSYEGKAGRTANYARAAGEAARQTSFVAGAHLLF